ncbi:MAG: phosphatase PAP2 family protein [Ignavibacteriales bacterium]|nr:phosphatase PAP2 family protein [Ignavibacteriales bacterium]
MLDFFYSIDVTIFYFINQTLANPFFDKFFVFITEVKNWYIAFVILWLICFFKGGRLGKVAAIGSIFLVIVSDQFSSFFVKNLVERIRPCNILPGVRDLTGCSSSFSFPSSHAVNNFAAAVFFYKFFPTLKWILFIVATLIAFSRVYVGRHYPSDIVGGAIIGAAIGYVMAFLSLKINDYIVAKYNSFTEKK